jgi:glycosyltransferase involved in cell wall biosynthesis
MRIAFISNWFAEEMGYAVNFLPRAIAALGHEVHFVTSNVQPYFNSPIYEETYESFVGPKVTACGIKEIDGYALHRLPYGQWRGRLYIKGLLKEIRTLRPQIVQSFAILSLATRQVALAKLALRYKLFLQSHVHASVFSSSKRGTRVWERLFWLGYASMLGRLASCLSEKCYAISTDAAEIAVGFFGVEAHKVNICPLGVDTDLFRPASDEASRMARIKLRQKLGFSESDVVCIYTGRFSEDKNPLCMAQAVGSLVKQGEPFRGLFVGEGVQTDVTAIRSCPGCVVHPFVPARELPPFYWAADIGVWPKQESTSQLDAVACGLPIILSNHVHVRERIDGNGLTYEEDDAFDLSHQIRKLGDPNLRKRMGDAGSARIREKFSWNAIASQRVQDYEAALRR